MPYDRLPARLRQLIPSEHGQGIFRGAFNAQLKAGRSESVAFASAWGALDRAGYKKGADGKYEKVEKSNPSAEVEKADTFKPPAGARAAARRAIRWKEKYGDKVKGGTQVGWTRAGQLARGESLSRETVARMVSFFARHKGNETVDSKFKGEPWMDNGHVAWLIWGGDAAASWSRNIMDRLEKRQIDDDQFTTQSEAMVRSMDLGLEGETHVHERDGQAVYMPGENHEQYIERIREIAGIESDEEPVKEGLLERAISAIIGAIMPQVDVNKSVVETQVLKMDDEQRIVYGWASVVTEDGEPVVDTQGDVITPEEMEKMANDFMLDVRKAKAMHTGGQVGEVIHSMPLTNELMKAFDIYSDREGWLVAFKIYDDDAWEKVRSGEFQALSIGGKAGSREELE